MADHFAPMVTDPEHNEELPLRPRGPVSSQIKTTIEAKQPITLQIGERSFKTTLSTLTAGSSYFASSFSGRRPCSLPDGSLFVDADPDAFAHVLRYLRTGAMPLFWSQAAGFDLGLYSSVLASADYFGVDKLSAWIQGKRFFEAVQFEHKIDCREVYSVSSLRETEVFKGDTERSYEAHWGVEKEYICPTDIEEHRGMREKCGKQCAKAQEGRDVEYEEEHVIVGLAVVTKKTSLMLNVCKGF